MANNPFTSHDLYAGGNELDALKAELAAINVEMTKLLTTAAQARAALVHLSTVKVQSQAQIISQATQAQALANKQQELAVRQSLKLDRMRALSAQQTASAVVAAQQREAIGEERVAQAKLRTELAAKRLEQAEQNLNRARKSSSGSLRNILSSLRTLTYAYFSLAAAQRIVGQLFTETKQLNTLDIAFKQVLGTQYQVAKAQEFLIDISQRFGTNILTASNAYLKFGAAAKQSGLDQQKTNDIFQSFAKASSVLGLGAERTSYVFLALEQIMSKGKLQTEELRRQLGEHLPGAFGIAAQAMGVTTAELTKMLKAGTILSTDFLPKFAKQVEIAYGIQNVEKVNNLAAAQERFNNQITLLVRQLDAAASFKSFFNTLAEALNFISTHIDGIAKLSKAVVYLASAWAAWRITLFATNLLMKFAFAQTLSEVTAKNLLAAATLRLEAAQGGLNKAMKANPVGAVIAAIIALLGVIDLLIKKYDSQRELQRSISEANAAASAQAITQKLQIDALVTAYGKQNITLDEKKKILVDLNALGVTAIDLDKDGVISIGELTSATDTYIESLKRRTKAQVLLNKYTEVTSQIESLKEQVKNPTKVGFVAELLGAGNIDAAFGTKLTQSGQIAAIKQMEAYQKGLEDELKKNGDFADIISKTVSPPPKTPLDPDELEKEFRQMIARRKKLNSFMQDGYDKELDMLRIEKDEELHISQDADKVLENHKKRVEELNAKYVLERRKIRTEGIVDEQTKEIEQLGIWYTEQEKIFEQYGIDITALDQQYKDKLTEINNKYIDDKDKTDQETQDRTLNRLQQEFDARQKIFKSKAVAGGASESTIGQLDILQEIQSLKFQRDLHFKHLKNMTDDELAANQALINEKTRQFQVGEAQIQIDALKFSQQTERTTFALEKHSAAEKKEFKIKQIKELYELQVRLDKTLTADQKATLIAAINDLNSIQKSAPQDLFELLNIDLSQEKKTILADSFSFVKDQMKSFLDFQKSIIDQEIQNADRKVQSAEANLHDQISLQAAGYSASVAQATKDLALAKRTQQQALKDRQRLQKTELAINTALEASNLILAVSKALTLGPILGPVAAAFMIASFAAAKIKAFQLVGKQTFRKGGFEEIGGGSHESGKDTFVGKTSKGDGYAERGESVGIFTAKATRRYKPDLRKLVNAANSGTLEQLIIRDERARGGIPIFNNNIDTSGVERRLDRLVEQGKSNSYVDSDGNVVTNDRGRITIKKKAHKF